jgi:hypothetical protein
VRLIASRARIIEQVVVMHARASQDASSEKRLCVNGEERMWHDNFAARNESPTSMSAPTVNWMITST